MKLGLMLPFRNPAFARVAWDDFYASHLDLAVHAETLGYDHVWLTEHHFVDDGYSPSLLPIAAAIAARTTRIRIGTFVLLLPLHDPVRVAEDAATVDVISRGRFDLGLGLGYRVGEFTGFGVPRSERGARLEEGALLIQRLFRGETVTFDGRFSKLDRVQIVPPPIQKGGPPIWLAARGPRAIRRAASSGFHFASTGLPAHQARYDEALRASGRDPAAHSIAQLRAVYVAPTRAQAWDECGESLHYMIARYAEWFGEANDLAGDRGTGAPLPTAAEMRAAEKADFFGEPAIVGTPADARELIAEYRTRTRGTHLVMAMALPGLAPARIRGSMELFAREVAPTVR